MNVKLSSLHLLQYIFAILSIVCVTFSETTVEGDKINLKTYPDDQDIKQAQEVVFVCRDEGNTRKAVRWTRGGGRTLPPGSSDIRGRLTMPNIQLEHAGTYYCEAEDVPPGMPGSRKQVTLRVIPADESSEPTKFEEVFDYLKKFSNSSEKKWVSSYSGDAITTWYSTPLVPGSIEDLEHPCMRKCSVGTEKRRCHYKFKIEWYITLSKACFNCPWDGSDCVLPHCISSDGHERPVVTVNRRMPGPSIQVCKGDEILVDVENDLGFETSTIHWHGIHQKGTPYMDGVPFLTQCPILPHNTFRYHFLADQPGTHYWHSHTGLQRGDGVFGSLIVREREDPHAGIYDVDSPLHVISITDWMDRIAIDKFVNHHHTEHENKPYNILINGMGTFEPLQKENTNEKIHVPIYEFQVEQGQRYRFRSISNALQNCPIEISIDDHKLLVIASDGQNLEPIEVDSLVIYAGERWDFVVDANQSPGLYWVKFKGLLDCDDRFLSAYQVALLKYSDASETSTSLRLESIKYEHSGRNGTQLNSLNKAPGDLNNFWTAADIKALDTNPKDFEFGLPDPDENTIKTEENSKLESKNAYSRTPDHKFWISYDFYARNNSYFHHEMYYPFDSVEKGKRLYMPQLNYITLKIPPAPPLSQKEVLDSVTVCNESSVQNCDREFCHCLHSLNVELGSLVEIILVDTGVVYYANHPFHLHGHVFAVMGMERLGDQTTLEKIKKMDEDGELKRNFNRPAIKDSVTVPDGGYTVLRFIADNPGFWLFHCHLSFHSEVGMALIFHVGHDSHLPKVPDNFPTCGEWTPEPVDDLTAAVSTWKSKLGDGPDINLLENDVKVPYETSASKDYTPSGSSTLSYSLYLLTILIALLLNKF